MHEDHDFPKVRLFYDSRSYEQIRTRLIKIGPRTGAFSNCFLIWLAWKAKRTRIRAFSPSVCVSTSTTHLNSLSLRANRCFCVLAGRKDDNDYVEYRRHTVCSGCPANPPAPHENSFTEKNVSLFQRLAIIPAFVLCYMLGGCSTPPKSFLHEKKIAKTVAYPQTTPSLAPVTSPSEPSTQLVSWQKKDSDSETTPSNETVDLTVGQVLDVDTLIASVHARNPSLQAAHAAWHEALQRYPQEISLQDPVLQSMIAPATLPSNSSVQSSYYIGLAQQVPWSGKRELRGQKALWEATAKSSDSKTVLLQLSSATRIAFFDDYLAHREIELNRQNLELMQDFRSTAKSKYEAAQVSQQDLSAADLELVKLEQQKLDLEKSKQIAIARINTLLHQRPDEPLPPPPKELDAIADLPEISELREDAIQSRPEIAALSARIQVERNAIGLALKEYYPDFEFMTRYDSFWTDRVQRGQLGMNMNIPIQNDRRAASVREAQFRVQRMCSELAVQQDAVNEEVQMAFAKVEASRKTVMLFKNRILSIADVNLETARAAYISGSIDFLRLMDARRQSTEQQIGYQRALTEYHRSVAELQRAIGN